MPLRAAHRKQGISLGLVTAEMRTFFSVRVLRGLDDGNRARSPQIVALALNTLCVQLIILGMELERHIVLLLVGHHQIQILATSAPHEGGFAGIECQYIHTAIFMDEGPRGLVASRSRQTSRDDA